jgi:hypothetical protein
LKKGYAAVASENKETLKINLSAIEDAYPEFRVMELYFIRLCNSYIQTIFWSVFTEKSSARKKLYAVVTENLKPKLNKKTKQIDDHGKFLRESIVPDPETGKLKYPKEKMDCISGQFTSNLLNKFDDVIIARFEEKLRRDYAIFDRFKDDKGNENTMTFVRAIEILYKRRNYLEHYNDDKKRNPTYSHDQLIQAMGLFLLPQMMHEFASQVYRFEHKLHPHIQKQYLQSHMVMQIASECVKRRRKSTHNSFANENTRANIKNKKERKALISDTLPWRQAYLGLRSKDHPYSKTDYRQHEFKLRYHFIGEANYRKIKAMLQKDAPDTPIHFKRDIESVYMLTARVHLIIQSYIGKIIGDMTDAQLDDFYAAHPKLAMIRNHIAHNGLFWDIHEYRDGQTLSLNVQDVFTEIIAHIENHLELGKSASNRFYTQMRQIFKDQDYTIIDTNDPIKTEHIRRWNNGNRSLLTKQDDNITIDRRKVFKKTIASWHRDLIIAHKGGLKKPQDQSKITRRLCDTESNSVQEKTSA